MILGDLGARSAAGGAAGLGARSAAAGAAGGEGDINMLIGGRVLSKPRALGTSYPSQHGSYRRPEGSVAGSEGLRPLPPAPT